MREVTGNPDSAGVVRSCIERSAPYPYCRRMTFRSLPFLAAASLACSAFAQPGATPSPVSRHVRADTASLRRALDSIADAHQGIVGYTVIDMETGARIQRRGDEKFPTASLIKVPILVTVFDLAAKNQISLDDPLTVLRIDQVPGSGVVQYLHNGIVLTVRDAAWLMTTISDNTATNLLLDRIIIRRVWAKMDSLGLSQTRVHSKSFLRSSSVAMDSSVKYGLGVTTPNEMARLFELLAQGKAVNPVMDSTMLDILRHNDDDTLLQRFAGGARAAHKTGATDAVRTECSLFYLRNRVVACVMTKENKDQRWVLDTEPQLTIANMGKVIIAAFGGVPPAQ
jgi:beta-lactamase class A